MKKVERMQCIVLLSLTASEKELREKELHVLELQEVYETCLLKMKVCVAGNALYF